MGDNSFAVFFKKLEHILSGPADLCGWQSESNLHTPEFIYNFNVIDFWIGRCSLPVFFLMHESHTCMLIFGLTLLVLGATKLANSEDYDYD